MIAIGTEAGAGSLIPFGVGGYDPAHAAAGAGPLVPSSADDLERLAVHRPYLDVLLRWYGERDNLRGRLAVLDEEDALGADMGARSETEGEREEVEETATGSEHRFLGGLERACRDRSLGEEDGPSPSPDSSALARDESDLWSLLGHLRSVRGAVAVDVTAAEDGMGMDGDFGVDVRDGLLYDERAEGNLPPAVGEYVRSIATGGGGGGEDDDPPPPSSSSSAVSKSPAEIMDAVFYGSASYPPDDDDDAVPPLPVARRVTLLRWAESCQLRRIEDGFDGAGMGTDRRVKWTNEFSENSRGADLTATVFGSGVDGDDAPLLRLCLSYVKAGDLGGALQACREAGQGWRCASWIGGEPLGPTTSPFDGEEKKGGGEDGDAGGNICH